MASKSKTLRQLLSRLQGHPCWQRPLIVNQGRVLQQAVPSEPVSGGCLNRFCTSSTQRPQSVGHQLESRGFFGLVLSWADGLTGTRARLLGGRLWWDKSHPLRADPVQQLKQGPPGPLRP